MIDHDAIGTHDVQEIKMINQSCFYIDIINGSEITEFQIQIVSSSKGEKFNLNVSRQNVTLCSPIVYNGTHNISFPEGSDLYNIYVYDDQTEETNGQPADGINNLKVLVTIKAEPAPSSPSSSSGKYKTLSDCYRYTFSFSRNCGSTCLFFNGGSIGLDANVAQLLYLFVLDVLM